MIRSNGEVFWVNTWFRGEKDNNAVTIKLHGVNQDITESKIIEESLIVSEDKYRTLFEADPNYTILDFFMQESSQGCLDAYLHSPSEPSLPGLVESGGKITEKPLGVTWFK